MKGLQSLGPKRGVCAELCFLPARIQRCLQGNRRDETGVPLRACTWRAAQGRPEGFRRSRSRQRSNPSSLQPGGSDPDRSLSQRRHFERGVHSSERKAWDPGLQAQAPGTLPKQHTSLPPEWLRKGKGAAAGAGEEGTRGPPGAGKASPDHSVTAQDANGHGINQHLHGNIIIGTEALLLPLLFHEGLSEDSQSLVTAGPPPPSGGIHILNPTSPNCKHLLLRAWSMGSSLGALGTNCPSPSDSCRVMGRPKGYFGSPIVSAPWKLFQGGDQQTSMVMESTHSHSFANTPSEPAVNLCADLLPQHLAKEQSLQTLELLLGLRSPHGAEGLVELVNLPSTVCTGKPCAFQQAPPDLRKRAASPALWNCDQPAAPHGITEPRGGPRVSMSGCQSIRVSEATPNGEAGPDRIWDPGGSLGCRAFVCRSSAGLHFARHLSGYTMRAKLMGLGLLARRPGRTATAQVTGDTAQVTGDAAQVTSDTAQVTGDAAQVTGDTAQVTGNTVQVTGDTAQVMGDAAEVTGDTAQVTGDTAQVTGDAGLTVTHCGGMEERHH
ncbi:Putative protein PFD1115c [Bos mutus]|uniref:Uncharacterized protein n=1 Tax=Bos mutus TaxID=72004 RepID=L8IPD8_9CETA|nr:Putative protein PFD1115c [Bos mutus]